MEDELYKFPSTPHVFYHPNIRDDKVISDKERLLLSTQRVIIEEKIDGANLGISFNANADLLLQNRGSFLHQPFNGQWKMLPDWLNHNHDNLFDCIRDQYIIFGEWCYARHSIHYTRLPDYYLAFDVFDKKRKIFLPIPQRNEIISNANLHCVPFLDEGFFELNKLSSYIKKSKFSDEISEGVYLRVESPEAVNFRAKIVRSDFTQNITEHWSRRTIKKNQIMINHF
ncbi:TPA: RNA ligase family protein [Klebsiella pneumoniae]|uniref:RNA ligase family protein n=1 Tax=Klebsiella pneumoniae TaxID=573 RepID=UPI00227394DE|nr:RNA ligase family protein [Klebsiella pneumoniae]HBQ3918152.1 RNA ligase family protein [Klebsiella pneumoniae]HBQ3921473.1 RNA ligase family protein [Klebsiella pneumoniae]HBS6547269.1 RNA ligase family protein [Klebsiella pneumoniae]HBS6550629.1 RNA ligase family protein [Klebsiella pneumoniae]